jgi:hypothetical protein
MSGVDEKSALDFFLAYYLVLSIILCTFVV